MTKTNTLTKCLKTSWLRPLLVAVFICVAGVASAADVVSLTSASGCCYPSGYTNQSFNVLGATVPGCNPPPVVGVCGGSLWACSSGNVANKNTSADYYSWQCTGANGGSTASCSQTIPGTWSAGGWSSCSVTACGSTGSQTRSVTCSNSNCASGSKPAISQSCSTAACAPTYTGYWYASTGGCSVSACGSTGTQTTSYSCSNGNCDPSTKPGSYNQSCSTPACAHVYTGYWYASTGSCSVTACGSTGSQSITYSCSNGDCDPATKPANGSQSCSTAACPHVYTGSWVASTGSCSVTACGSTGSQAITYSCSNGDCDPATKPANGSQTCSTAACPKTCTWKGAISYLETYCTSTTSVSTYGLYAGAACDASEAGGIINSIGDPDPCPGYRLNARRVTDNGALKCSCN